ncbi:MAG: FAD-dependent oxidoreductase [Myxococcales bacterium]|nr:FAD-dependent oxidoreductase [Myxococcales bacterium]
MESVRTLIVGAGVSGLATAAWLKHSDYLLIEADREIGGYCKTVVRDGFVWDYSGHFFHFQRPEVERWLVERMGGQRVRTVRKRAFISYGGRLVDFPFQKNIHQLPTAEFLECLHDLYFARAEPGPERSFQEMLYSRFGRAIAEKFLVPYNEKLNACDLARLDVGAMGRFFPHADVAEVIRNMRRPEDKSYNATFTYPEGGAVQYVKALASAVRPEAISLEEPLLEVDLGRKVARTPRREIRFQHLVSSAPFNRLVQLAGLPHDAADFSWNKVLVFNLGFDRKGPREAHWIYYPDRSRCFYRVGFYDNIFEADRMSLYVEVGLPHEAAVDAEAMRSRVLRDLEAERVVDGHRLVAHHSVVMDPAYVHITKESIAEHRRLSAALEAQGVFSIGRYGGWTYCSIEDNLIQAKALAERLG